MDGNKIEIGKNVFINYQCFFDNNEKIIIDDNVHLGMKTSIITSSHNIDNDKQRAGIGLSQEVHIKMGSWIAAGVMILPGITIGKGCVIAAGSVVTKDTEDNCLYAGIPAKKIKEL